MRFGPSLPDQARDPQARAEELKKAQDDLAWDWSWPPGCATLRDLPKGDRYGLRFVLRIGELSLEVTRNHAKLAIDGVKVLSAPSIPDSVDDLEKGFFSVAERFHEGAPRTRPRTVADYVDYFAAFEKTAIVDKQTKDPALSDALFAWQRVAGANPMSLARVRALPEGFALSEAQWAAVASGWGAGSLAASLAEGKVYVVDFTALHGAPATRYLGRQKYLCGTRGLFFSSPKGLMPVGIQLEPGGTVFTPKDGVAWTAAKFCFQVADANIHETMEHLGRTHMVMEAVGIAARRQLSEDHPLRRLIEPHIEGTFAINHSAKTSLIAPEGIIDHVFAARIDVAAGLVRKALDGFVLQDRAPTLELAARGLDDPSLDCPYRDDVLSVYAAIRRFSEALVNLYYDTDARVSGDVELRAWVAEVGSPIGGALTGIRPVETKADLVTWMANIIHIGSAQHAAVNFPQYPYFSWGASVAGALWAPPGGVRAGMSEAELLSLMPPWDCLILQADTVYQLSSVYYNRLGDYSVFLDLDPHLGDIVKAFQKELLAIDSAIAERDKSRLLSYPYLRPSLIPSSINI